MALALELFTEGSLNVFAHQSNVDTSGRIIAYDILDLGEQLKPIGLLIMLDNILNRVIANRKKGRYTRRVGVQTFLNVLCYTRNQSAILSKTLPRF